MAIISPTDLPAILKVQSDPMKGYVLRELGYPNIAVEITEDQLESSLRVTGDFISQYFPREQKIAVFNTNPLQSTYPMPEDAYWIQEVSWDPVTTRIDDVFGAESFLFCLSNEFKILDKDGSLQYLGEWNKNWKAKTPYGNKKLKIIKRDNNRQLPKVKIEYQGGCIEATNNHVLKSEEKWKEFSEIKLGDGLYSQNTILSVDSISYFESTDAISVRAVGAGCYYGCTDGEPIMMH